MIGETLETFAKFTKASFWKVAFLLMTLLFIVLLVDIFFKQGDFLSHQALNNAQRVLLPLHKDGEFIGTQVSVELKDNGKVSPRELATAPAVPPATPIQKPEVTQTDSPTPETPKSQEMTTEIVPARPQQDDTTQVVMGDLLKSNTEPPVTVEKRSPGKALAAAPVARITEKVGEFNLPRIADDGTKPWKHYAKPFDDSGKPLIAIVVQGLGLGRITTENALNLNDHVTLSFSPYAKNTNMWASHARNIGHEVLLDLPQETTRYPAEDPGPYALLNSLDDTTNRQRLHWVMSRTSGFVGLMQPDNPAIKSADMLRSLSEVANRGLFYLETPYEKTDEMAKSLGNMGMIAQGYNLRIDEVLNEESIRNSLNQLVKLAKENGVAIGVTRPYPLSLELINQWTAELKSLGVELAPVSAIVEHER